MEFAAVWGPANSLILSVMLTIFAVFARPLAGSQYAMEVGE